VTGFKKLPFLTALEGRTPPLSAISILFNKINGLTGSSAAFGGVVRNHWVQLSNPVQNKQRVGDFRKYPTTSPLAAVLSLK
jgi:hypothetical protein